MLLCNVRVKGCRRNICIHIMSYVHTWDSTRFDTFHVGEIGNAVSCRVTSYGGAWMAGVV